MSRFVLLVPVAILLVGADAPEDQAKKELKKFEGTWVLTSGEHNGGKISDEHVKKSKITWKGNTVTVETPHQSKEVIKATVHNVKPGKKPAEMDWVRANGPHAGQKMLAIYEFINDDEYRISFAPAGKERPKEFSTKADSGHRVHVWKRVKE